MSPKSTFTVPRGDVIELVTETRKTRRGIRTIEKKVPFHSGREPNTTKASTSKIAGGAQSDQSAAKASKHPSDDTDELHPLHAVEEDFELEGDNAIDLDLEESLPSLNVCALLQYLDLLTNIYADTNGAMAQPT